MSAKRIIALIILIPIAVILIAFIVANRQIVALTFNPFQPGSEGLTFYAPLFVWLFSFFIIGILIGGLTVWFTQHRFRKALKDTQTELQGLKLDIAKKSEHYIP
ncbi:lipopolysaccharide assembly protein LapA domain-containing protein [Bartonella tamiae]|uniref:Lipopolysaccharide assembly protein A domain-containing protein n=1 Tax=Bartonella tamiae Th239 TaxID=1094558 RepID=J0QY71_9HYPH|nr:LapA family protein [Bartonella tamiae]EJF91041.1 hypothetical protein ME5_00373 [Bartonella tamiae Th239]EJF93294.1 hypothetical protein MEG_01508 [Bartonella tamiae Th307]